MKSLAKSIDYVVVTQNKTTKLQKNAWADGKKFEKIAKDNQQVVQDLTDAQKKCLGIKAKYKQSKAKLIQETCT